MAWFLALQGPTHRTNQSTVYQLNELVNREELAQQFVAAATTDGVVAVAAVFGNHLQVVTLYIRPAAWGLWTFYELSDDERKDLPTGNMFVDAIAQAARQRQERKSQE